jgi:hypothetical protein
MARVATLGQLHRPPGWLRVYCASYPSCGHSAPMALAPLVIRWGPHTSSEMLRRCARCTRCGHKGATLQHPSWVGNGFSCWQPFPVELVEDNGGGKCSQCPGHTYP